MNVFFFFLTSLDVPTQKTHPPTPTRSRAHTHTIPTTMPSALILFSQDPTCSQSVLPSILVQTRVMWFQPDQRESPDFLSNLIGSVLYMWPIRSQIRMQIQSTRWVAVGQLVLVLEGWRQSFRFEDIIGRGSTYRECMKPLIWRRPFWSTQPTPAIDW